MTEKFESKEKPKFEIVRSNAGEFETYDAASTEEEAIAKYLEAIRSVSNPSEITIYEFGNKNKNRSDLVKKADATLRVEVDPKNINWDKKIDDDTVFELGFSLMHGTQNYDYHGQPMSLNEMAEMEANSWAYARKRKLQTTVDPGNGVYVSFTDSDSELAKKYKAKVQEYLKVKESKE